MGSTSLKQSNTDGWDATQVAWKNLFPGVIFWFHPDTLEFAGFHLIDGQYQPLQANPQGWLWSQQLQLFLGVHQRQLRFFTPDRQLVYTPEEAAAQAETSLAQA